MFLGTVLIVASKSFPNLDFLSSTLIRRSLNLTSPDEICFAVCRFFLFWVIMFLVHQMSVAMFRLMGAAGRTLVIATTLGSTVVLFIVTLSGFVLAYPQVRPSNS